MADRQDEAQQSMKERIDARKAIIQQRLKQRRQKGNDGVNATNVDADDADTKVSKGEEQVRMSRRELAMLKAKAADSVTRFRVATDANENDRRIDEEDLAKARKQRVAEDANSSFKAHGSIQMSFDNLFDANPVVPQELMKDLMKQKEACSKVIETKDKLIDDLRSTMRDKEDEYVRTLKRQADDIDNLILEMHSQTRTMVASYENQLDAIEKAYVQERAEVLEQNQAEIVAFTSKRDAAQENHTKKREEVVAEQQKILEMKYEENAEKFNKSKMDNLHDIHGLAQELETLRARYLLNNEKLNYSLQVLRERVKENKRAGELHRKKIGRLTDVQSNLLARQHEAEKRFKAINSELTESYKRVTEQYKDLQLKFQHFEKADVEKHQQVWNMHETDCMKLVHKCLQGDRVIYEELLGVAWVPPSLDFWATAQAEENQNVEEDDEQAEEEEALELGETADAVLRILYDQVPFLVDDKSKKVISELDEEEGHQLKVEAVLAALDIKQSAEVRTLLEFFTTPTDEGVMAIINPQEAVRALKNFMEDRASKKEAQKNKLKLSLDGTATSGAGDATMSKQAKKKDEAKKQREREAEFWERMANVVPQSHIRLWTSSELGLEKYLKQLQQRQKLIDETDVIRKQNDELRALLNQYLSSELNAELYSPPQLQVAAGKQ